MTVMDKDGLFVAATEEEKDEESDCNLKRKAEVIENGITSPRKRRATQADGKRAELVQDDDSVIIID